MQADDFSRAIVFKCFQCQEVSHLFTISRNPRHDDWNTPVACSLAHGLHSQSREPVRDHAADDEEGEGGGLQDVHARLHPQTDHEGAVPQSDETGRTPKVSQKIPEKSKEYSYPGPQHIANSSVENVPTPASSARAQGQGHQGC